MARRWLLDTCVLSEPMRPQPGAAVLDWLRACAHESCVATASFGELHYGLACLPQGVKRNRIQAWATQLSQQFDGHVLPTDQAIWKHYGELKASLKVMRRMQDALDMVIAATALANGLTLVIRNTRQFVLTGVPLFNPWGDAAPQQTA